MILTKDESSLLLYLESQQVDKDGRVDNRHLNDLDRHLMKGWNTSGFVYSGRLPSCLWVKEENTRSSLWCSLSEEATNEAANLRKERSKRGRQRFLKTLEQCEPSRMRDEAIKSINQENEQGRV